MTFSWTDKLRNFLQALAFCLAVAAIYNAFMPHWRYEIPLVYSLSIGISTWALIDFGRHLLKIDESTGSPKGVWRIVLNVAGIAGGYVAGTLFSDWWFGWSTWGGAARSHLPASLLFSALCGMGGTYYFYNKGKGQHLQRRIAQANLHASEAQLKLLQTQLEPHMLFNTLANLRALISVEPARALLMLDHLVAYLRATLDASRATSHSLQAEFDRLRDYLELMAVRMGPRLAFTLDLPPELAQHPVPPLLLQALVENSIQHGLEPKVQGGSITISARRSGEQLLLEVADTGVGSTADLNLASISLESTSTSSSFGVAQVRARLQASYAERAGLAFVPGSQGGTRACIHIPFAL